MNYSEIIERQEAIEKEIRSKGTDLSVEQLKAFNAELEGLQGQLGRLREKEEIRKAMLNNIANNSNHKIIANFNDNAEKSEQAEYRSAWLKRVQGIELNEIEKRALNTVANSQSVIPVEVSNAIINKITEQSNLLNKITLTHINGATQYSIALVEDDAILHTEGAKITPQKYNDHSVKLSGYEIVKLIQISDAVKNMSVTAFESWLTDNLSRAILNKINNLLVNGTGSNEPKGIDKANATWTAGTNAVEIEKDANLKGGDVLNLVGMLKAGYDNGASFIMKKRTLFTDFLPLMDNSKHNLVTREGSEYFILGYPVVFNDYVADHEAYLGNLKYMCANLAEDVTIKTSYDIDTNTHKYAGIAVFDCTPATGDAFVKLVKKTA